MPDISTDIEVTELNYVGRCVLSFAVKCLNNLNKCEATNMYKITIPR
jgi:hypothetical protein